MRLFHQGIDKAKQQSKPTINPKTKHMSITVDSLKVALVQVNDDAWWTENDINPYGTKLWPASLGVAQLLASENLTNRSVLELGCGTGLVSLVAAIRGAHAIATDISPLVLSLVQEGWQTASFSAGTLETAVFDVTSSSPLPIHGTELPPIVAASAMMYQADLAEALAKRVSEAYRLGAWIIIGDDDTGNREGGRERFEAELQRYLQLDDVRWVRSTVRCRELKWAQKHVEILQLNNPSLQKGD
jgi:predicted nicotinamide N-methyase